MFDGIQFHRLFGETTTTSWLEPSLRLACIAAVCPAIPAPRITNLLISLLLLRRFAWLLHPLGTRRPVRSSAARFAEECQVPILGSLFAVEDVRTSSEGVGALLTRDSLANAQYEDLAGVRSAFRGAGIERRAVFPGQAFFIGHVEKPRGV
jgi:hypothetical protein